jgi:16S rRNA (cytosine967-C5)-methyltransferase
MAHESARKLALAALIEWRQGSRFADAILQQLLANSALGVSDRSFATELFYGVLRNLTLLDFWIARLRSAPLDDASRDLLRLGLYQLFILRTPGHAAVFETVALASSRRRSLVNAVLRNAQRRFVELDAAATAAPLFVQTSHPAFLIDRWTKLFGEQATAALCAWDNEPAPIYARINELRAPSEQLGEPLAAAPGFVQVDRIPNDALTRGECYIQDPSTRVACELLAPEPGETILDACAAPGGKSGLLAQLMQNRGTIVACDRDAGRVRTLEENLQRLGVTIARVVQHDWRVGPLANDDARSFDRILIDAPCTNTGVMRRRVDVRWRLQPADFQRMQAEQLAIIGAVLPLLKPGGALVYSTCSIEPEENQGVVERTLEEFPFLRLKEQRAVLPFRDGFDGAFAAKLGRTS